MKSGFPTNDTIRQYLLGQLDDQSDLEARLSEQMLLDDELSEIADSIEDEIIEDYLDGKVSASDRKKIEEYFLRPAERKEKLRFSLLLRSRFETNDALAKKKLYTSSESKSSMTGGGVRALAYHWVFQFRTASELTALLLLVVISVAYVSVVRNKFQSQLADARKTQAQLESQLALERERSASLTKQIQEVRPPAVFLTFLGPAFRANEGAPVVDLRPWTERIKVELDLRNAPSGDYDVRLETGTGRTVWSQSRVPASSGGLRFEMPAQGLSNGAYCFTVNTRLESYCFRVRRQVN